MITFLIAYIAVGTLVLLALAFHESTRKGPQDFTFVISIGMLYPPLLLLMLLLWPLAAISALLIFFSSKGSHGEDSPEKKATTKTK